MIGETVSHYRIVQKLGQGGMGEVYLAEDTRLKRPVALKVLRGDRDQDPAARERLLGEARAASALNHPHIAVVYEIDEIARDDGPLRFIAMEYVAGESFGDVARRRDLDLDTVLDLGLQVADALSEAHARGIVHRDIKPSNLLVTDSGRVKVLDFGLAQYCPRPGEMDPTWTRGPEREREQRGLLGTLAYMAPEQARGDEIDGRADEFSLGAVLYELASGRSAFGRPNPAHTLDAILHQEPAALVGRTPDPRWPHVEAVLRRMLAKEPSARYAGLREVADDLRGVRQGHGPSAARAVAPPPRAVAVLDFVNITRNGEDDWIGTGIAETLTSDLKNVEGLTMISRPRVHEVLRASGAAQGDPGLPARLGREVGARWVVSGGFQRAGESVRVTAQLLEAATGQIVRTVKMDGRLDDIFELQDRLACDLDEGLRLGLQPVDRPSEETHVVEAYEAFTRGLLNVRVETFETLDRSVLLFEKAVRLDPSYARAHLELASALAGKADYLAASELHERALGEFKRALELKPDLVRAWRELGWVLLSLGRDDEGLQAVERGLALDPEDAGALAGMARALFIGRADFAGAADWFDRALARNPNGGWYALQLAHCAALLRQFERGEAAARRAVELQEASLSGQQSVHIVGAYMRLGHLAALQGRPAEALSQFDRELAFLERVEHALRGRISIELQLRRGAALVRLQRRDEAAAAFDSGLTAFDERVRLGADDPFTRYYAAAVHAQRGETQEALVSLEKAARLRRRFTTARARIEPEFEPLRQEPAFAALVGSEGIPGAVARYS
jgi:TolB-like protein/tetratricopeptide (TPR) repeat protein/predicted Ser/Thr protein kinase